MKEQYNAIHEKMNKTLDVLSAEFGGIRAGRANPQVLDRIHVDYYGVSTPISQIGNISVPDARTLMIQPWDASVVHEVEKAINQSDLGINPQNDGKVIRLTFPVPTEERRKELVKSVHKKGEDGKVAIRSIRRDALEGFKTQKKNGEITEDDLKGIEKDIQKITDDFIADIDKMVDKKEKEIMEV